MDWIRYPYRVQCQFNDGGPPSVIQWTEAHPDAPTLSVPSAICNLALELDKNIFDAPIGEVWDGYGRRAHWAETPAGIDGQRRCGTDVDFMFGGHYDPDAPPQQYGALGWPICCFPPKKVFGGAGAGGKCVVGFVTPIALVGGYQVGGLVASTWRQLTQLQGGYSLGGTLPIQYTLPLAVQGGTSLGGLLAQQYTVAEPVTGGASLGGFAPSQYAVVIPPTGGVMTGGQLQVLTSYVDVLQGGEMVGGSIPAAVVWLLTIQGGVAVGGLLSSVYDQYGLLGTISTTNATGGPVLLTSNITLTGAGSVTLSVAGQTITITGARYDRYAALVQTAVAISTSVTGTKNRLNVVTAALGSPITLTVPTGATGDVWPVVIASGSQALVTLSGTVGGVASKVLFAGESFTAVYTGGDWVLDSFSLNPMACVLTSSVAQTSVSSGVATQLTLNTTSSDTTGLMAGSNQIAIKRTGVYAIGAAVEVDSGLNAPATLNASFQFYVQYGSSFSTVWLGCPSTAGAAGCAGGLLVPLTAGTVVKAFLLGLGTLTYSTAAGRSILSAVEVPRW